MAREAGSLITVVRTRPDPLSKNTHTLQTHSVTGCNNSLVRLCKYANFDVCCVLFIFLLLDYRQMSFFILDFLIFSVCGTVSFQHLGVRHMQVPERTTSPPGQSSVFYRLQHNSYTAVNQHNRERCSASHHGRSLGASWRTRDKFLHLSSPSAKQITICA